MQYHIDTNRIYVTGLSLGGFGAWDQITQNPSLYAAAVPLSGGGDPSLAPLITSVPVWNFHSANDSVVNVLFSREMITAVRLAGGNPIYTEYATGDHPIWSIGYYTPGLVDWVFAQKRGQPLNGFLQTTFTSPTTGATNVTLAGVCGDASAAVSGLNAYNVQTAAFSTVTGATNWTAPNIPLQPDATNRIVVTAVGTSWSAILGGSTSFNNSLLVTQVAAPIELTIARNRGSLLLSWSGGVPPYVIQQRFSLTAGERQNFQTTNGASLLLPLIVPSAFYRVQGQ